MSDPTPIQAKIRVSSQWTQRRSISSRIHPMQHSISDATGRGDSLPLSEERRSCESFCNRFLKHSHDLSIHEQFDIPAVIAGIDVYLLLVIHAITPLMNLNNNRDRNVIWCLRRVL